jgi:thioredoxin-like negative regulator of GroEL
MSPKQPQTSHRQGSTVNLRLASLAAFAAALSACTTFGGGKKTSEALDAAPGHAVVQQIAKKDPVASEHPRSYWLAMRQKKGMFPKLRGALATGEAEPAAQLARGILKKRPGDPDAMSLLAAALVLQKQYELAAYYAGLVEKARPNDPVALNIRGLAAVHGPSRRPADYQRALQLFHAAAEGDASQVAPVLNMASLMLELGNAKGALGAFETAASRCDRCTAALMGVGLSASRAREFAKAKAAFADVLAKNPSHAGALYSLALVYRNGYNDKKQAEGQLYALLNDQRVKDAVVRERAQVLLRMMKGEATAEERLAASSDDDGESQVGKAQDAKDAELLMTDAEGGGAE